MTEAVDELGALPALAAKLSVEPMSVRRIAWTDASGHGISALQWGEGAPESVYLHGGGLHAHAWNATILLRGRPALALDLPGHGDSDWRDDLDYGPESLGRSVAEVLTLALDAPVTIVGHSLGGLAAIAATPLIPHLVDGMVIVDISPGREITPSSRRLRAFFAGPPSYASLDELLDRAVAHGIGKSRESIRQGMLLNTRVRPDGRVEFKHHLASLPPDRRLQYDPSTLWEHFSPDGPAVLLVYGTRGHLSAAMVEKFLERVPHSAATALESGHDVHREAPGPLAEAIEQWKLSIDRSTTRKTT